MLNLITFIIGIVTVFLLARYNKSNKLFWILLISMLSGFVGGTVAANCAAEKKVDITKVTSLNVDYNVPALFNITDMGSMTEIPAPHVKDVIKSHSKDDIVMLKQPVELPEFCPGILPEIVDTS